MPKKRKARARIADSTMLSISLSEDLLAAIDKMAAAERRSRSNFIATVMENLAKQKGI